MNPLNSPWSFFIGSIGVSLTGGDQEDIARANRLAGDALGGSKSQPATSRTAYHQDVSFSTVWAFNPM
jgi:hypothetical protein